MIRPSNCFCHRVCPVLALVGLISGFVLSDHLWSRRGFAQGTSTQGTNPSWSLAGSLKTRREGHTATLLPNGHVLVAGGHGASPINSTELYDPAIGTWSNTGSLNVARSGHTATLLPNGKVLIAGGASSSGGHLTSVELYDPATASWSPTGHLNEVSWSHTATLLPNGKVLVVGGHHTARGGLNRAELYDSTTERWSTITNLHVGRFEHTATLLPDGKVLVVGGRGNFLPKSAELYDPATESWSTTGNLNIARAAHMAVLLPNDKVLVMGGFNDFEANDSPIPINSAELYDPTSGTWSVTGNLNTPRFGGTATRLLNGKVLVMGELYDPLTRIWGIVPLPDQPHGYAPTATLLPNGKVLVTGDNSAELFDPGQSDSETVASVSAASYRAMGLASEAIAASFGANLAVLAQAATALPLPTSLGGTIVKVKDTAGIERLAPLFFVSPTQVNYQIPPGTALGPATVTVTSGDGAVSTGVAQINRVAPSLFSANASGEGVAGALALRVKTDGTQSYEPVVQFDAAQNGFVARPLDLGPEGEQVFLLLFGTAIRHRSSLTSVIAAIGGTYAEVSLAGPQGDFVGLDQVNVRLPRSLAGRGVIDVLLTVEAQIANPVRIQVK